MKRLLLLAILVSSFSAMANCTIKTTARILYVPLSIQFSSYELEADSLLSCQEEAKSNIGLIYDGKVGVGVGGPANMPAMFDAKYKVFKVKYRYLENGILYKGKY